MRWYGQRWLHAFTRPDPATPWHRVAGNINELAGCALHGVAEQNTRTVAFLRCLLSRTTTGSPHFLKEIQLRFADCDVLVTTCSLVLLMTKYSKFRLALTRLRCYLRLLHSASFASATFSCCSKPIAAPRHLSRPVNCCSVFCLAYQLLRPVVCCGSSFAALRPCSASSFAELRPLLRPVLQRRCDLCCALLERCLEDFVWLPMRLRVVSR
jgi:hypothetical protein